jgi:serine protease Do
MPRSSPTRRDLLGAASAIAAGSLAGCGAILGGDSATPTPTPELPNIEKRTIQRDRAAVTHIFSLVEGRIEWPSLAFANDGLDEVVGVWEIPSETLRLNPDATFTIRGESGDSQGTFVANESPPTLRLRFESGGEAVFRYERYREDGRPHLELTSDGERFGPYERTSGEPSTEDSIEMIKQLRAVRATGAEAGTSGQDLESGSTGSGFIVSSDGYIVTNAHVVLADEEPGVVLFRRLASQFSRELRAGLREDLADENLSDADLAEIQSVLFDELVDYLLEYGSLERSSTSFNVLNGSAGPDDDVEVNSWPARVERAGTVRTEVGGETTWGNDVAVLSVDQDNLPVVSLGSAEGVETGDEIFVVGYPAIGIENLFADRETALEPTLTTGIVSARRELRSGINSIQTEAAINNGNSGGPMYDQNGDVVGIATFGPARLDVEDVGFGLPIEVATEMLDDLGIENERGEMDRAFDSGLDAYWRGDCETATTKFEEALELYPDHPYANEFIEDCESGEAPGQGNQTG